MVVLVSTRSPKLIDIARRSPLRYWSEAQPGPCSETTGILNSRQQLQSFVEQLQYLLADASSSCCRFLLCDVIFACFRSTPFLVLRRESGNDDYDRH